MKKIVWFAFLLTILCQCTPKDNLITDKRVSNLKIGSNESNVLSRLEMYHVVSEIKDDDIAGFRKYYNIYDNNKLILTLNFYQNKLRAIQVHDNRYYTSKGIKIGNTAQEVLNKGHKIWAIKERSKYLLAQIEEDNVYFYFQKKMTKSREIGKYAMLESIAIGYAFDIYEILGNVNEKSENLGIVNNDTFYSEKFNLELLLPNEWSNKTKESNIPSVNELLFLTNNNEESSLLIIAQKLSSSKYSNGFDYLTQNKEHFPSLSNISSNPVSIANQEFYTGVMEVEIDGRTQKQLHYCTVKNQYAVIITGKFFDKKNEEEIKELIRTIKAHNNLYTK